MRKWIPPLLVIIAVVATLAVYPRSARASANPLGRKRSRLTTGPAGYGARGLFRS